MTSRRAFILAAGGAAGAATLPLAAAAAAGVPVLAGIPLLSTRIAPSGHDARGAALAGLGRGDLLALRREPGNDYDPRAVAVHAADGRRLGYIPRAHNEALANLLDAGLAAVARVREVAAEVKVDVVLATA